MEGSRDEGLNFKGKEIKEMSEQEMNKKELVTLEEVKVAEGTKSNKALRELVAEMELYQQKLIDLSKFKAAKAAIECVKCEKVLDPLRDDLDREMCRDCIREEEREIEKKKEIKKYHDNLRALVYEMNRISSVYGTAKTVYKIGTDSRSSYSFISNGRDCEIEKSHYYSSRGRYSIHSTSHPCFEIRTSDFGIKADLRSYFGSPGLAKRLHKKCVELQAKVDSKNKKKEEEADTLMKAKKLALATFPELKPDGIEVKYPASSLYSTPSQRRRNFLRGPRSIRFKVGRLHLEIYLGSSIVYLLGITDLSVEEIKKIQEVLS